MSDLTDTTENDVARIVGRDLSKAARDLANREGWADHARMHPATARKYEARVMVTLTDDEWGAVCRAAGEHAEDACDAFKVAVERIMAERVKEDDR